MKQSIKNLLNEYLSDLRLQDYLNELDKFSYSMENVNLHRITNCFYRLGNVFLILTNTHIHNRAALSQAIKFGRLCFDHKLTNAYTELKDLKMPGLLRELTEDYLEIGRKIEGSLFQQLERHPSTEALDDYLIQCIELFDYLAEEIISLGKRYQSY
jgi:hypothetical protein